jgi:hypothetical protein
MATKKQCQASKPNGLRCEATVGLEVIKCFCRGVQRFTLQILHHQIIGSVLMADVAEGRAMYPTASIGGTNGNRVVYRIRPEVTMHKHTGLPTVAAKDADT